METRTHHRIFYAWHGAQTAALLGAAVAGATMLAHKPSIEDIPRVYHASAVDLAAVPWGGHSFTVFASPSSGDFPDEVADAIRAKGGRATLEPTLDGHAGCFVSPDTVDGHAIAAAISRIVGESVGIYDHGGAFEVSVGVPAHKRSAD